MLNRFISRLDSGASTLVALSDFLAGRDFRLIGRTMGSIPARVAGLINLLPPSHRERVYALGAWLEGVPPRRLGALRSEGIARWTVSHYRGGPYPGAAIGSSNGAMLYLCAALGIPWLPQTFLVPVRRRMDPDCLREDLEWSRKPARSVLAANPDFAVHQMHDPVQDRLIIGDVALFRVKRLRLGAAYRHFLEGQVSSGGTLLLSECTLPWPVVRVSERHYFQTGGLGETGPDEYLNGGSRVEEFLRRCGSTQRLWEAPRPTGEMPEGEWGFLDPLEEDVNRFASDRGHQLRRVVFRDPADLSPFVADLYRYWYERRGLASKRLLAQTYVLYEPRWTVRTGSIPFWLPFNTERSALALERYLDASEPFDEIYATLMPNGVDGIGIASIERWKSLLGRAPKWALLGIDHQRYPRDPGAFIRYQGDLRRTIKTRVSPPEPLTMTEFGEFVELNRGRYHVEIRD